jgi:outer membrane protein
MKNISLALNGVLLVAVAVLYYLHFSANSASQPAASAAPTDLKFAYINSDSVLKNYEYFKVNRNKLEAKGKKLDQDLRNRAQSLQNEYESYQRNLSNLTIGQAKAIEEDLGKKQQNLELYRQSLEQELMTEQSKMNTELYAKVTQFLKKYGQENGLQVVLKFDPSSDLLFGGDSLDITGPVVDGLNKDYTAESAKDAVVKKDTTVKK